MPKKNTSNIKIKSFLKYEILMFDQFFFFNAEEGSTQKEKKNKNKQQH